MTTHTVGKWMTKHVVKTGPKEPLFTGLELMAEEQIRHVLVVVGDEVKGILSNRDVVRATMANPDRRLDLHGTLIEKVMTPGPLQTIRPTEPLSKAAEEFLYHKINALPVVDEHEKVIGILTTEDVLRAVLLSEAPSRRPDL